MRPPGLALPGGKARPCCWTTEGILGPETRPLTFHMTPVDLEKAKTKSHYFTSSVVLLGAIGGVAILDEGARGTEGAREVEGAAGTSGWQWLLGWAVTWSHLLKTCRWQLRKVGRFADGELCPAWGPAWGPAGGAEGCPSGHPDFIFSKVSSV